MTAPLLERVCGLIERTYQLGAGLPDPAPFVIGDAGIACLYGIPPERRRPMLLVRSSRDAHHIRVYYPDRLIENLERHDPSRGLSRHNLRDFVAFVEEIDHLLVLVACIRRGRKVPAVELELHANVTKFLVASLFLARTVGTTRLTGEQKSALRWELLERGDYGSEDPELRQRYLDARRHAIRFLGRLESLDPADRPSLLRRFSRSTLEDKLALCA
jgi:hypothetical protein